MAPNFYGDFYPLTPYSLMEDVWVAWQFHRPEAGEGMVQAFRREGCDILGYQFSLRGLEPDGRYEVTNFDVPGQIIMTGRELMNRKLKIHIEVCPGAAVVMYKRVFN